MDINVYGKKQYWILMGLAAVTILILPLLCNLYTVSAFSLAERNISSSMDWIVDTILNIAGLSARLGFAASVFLVMRYRFRLCLPIVAFQVANSIASILIYVFQPASTYYNYYLFAVLVALISFAVVFAEIATIKAITKHIKKEAVQFFIIFLGLFVIQAVFAVVNLELNSLLTVRQLYPDEIQIIIKSQLFYTFCAAFFYLVLRFLFAHNRRQTARRFFAGIKAEIQKSIE